MLMGCTELQLGPKQLYEAVVMVESWVNRQLKQVSLTLHAPQLSFIQDMPRSQPLSASTVEAHPLSGGSTQTPAEQALPQQSYEHLVRDSQYELVSEQEVVPQTWPSYPSATIRQHDAHPQVMVQAWQDTVATKSQLISCTLANTMTAMNMIVWLCLFMLMLILMTILMLIIYELSVYISYLCLTQPPIYLKVCSPPSYYIYHITIHYIRLWYQNIEYVCCWLKSFTQPKPWAYKQARQWIMHSYCYKSRIIISHSD